MNIEQYFEDLNEKIEKNYSIAKKARALGLDAESRVEVSLALSMAEKVVKLISTKYPQLDSVEVVDRILDLEKKYGSLDASVAFVIAEEVSKEKFCKFDTKIEAIDAGIRVGFAYITLGVVSSPIEGFTEIKSGRTELGQEYLKAYFSGPIRSAGTTASCVVLMLIDYLRQKFGYAKYDPTEEECKRMTIEIFDYHERVTNLQYCPTEEEMMFISKHIPIQICGDPTEKKEVSNYKDLRRIETNFIRGGVALIMAEGLAQKAQKGLRILKGVQGNGLMVKDWEWLDEYVVLHEERTSGKTEGVGPTYLKDLVAGRPVFGYPHKGFRFRYGRCRNSGFSAVGVHPATMAVTNNFIAIGTQLKIEKPTKGCVATSCDSIDGPIVKFKNGNVRKLNDFNEAKMLYDEIEEIIYLGDILFPLSDVQNRNANLVKAGYVEEWWNLELKDANKEGEGDSALGGMGVEDCFNVDIDFAIKLSKEYNIPLHPKYIFYWSQISKDEFLELVEWLRNSYLASGKLLFPYNTSEKEKFKIGKRALELLGIDHEVVTENVVLDIVNTKALLLNLGLEDCSNFNGVCGFGENLENKEVLDIINGLSHFVIKDKAGEFIGSRMGRPEKAKFRKSPSNPNSLFFVGNNGGRFSSVNAAAEKGFVEGYFLNNFCKKCSSYSIYNICEKCGEKTIKKYYCKMCDKDIEGRKCEYHGKGRNFKNTSVDVNRYLEKARERLGYLDVEIPDVIKGVKNRTLSFSEHLEKGILRAKYGLLVNKDGTIRYDATELPLTHFKPKEISVNIEKLKALGYDKDYLGEDLVVVDQILELKPHDLILPCGNIEGRADKAFTGVANFIDELLVKFYKLNPYYNIKTRDDLVGQLGVCIAPHNCAGVVCRFIGFSKAQGVYASPYMHAAVRRDCDGDEFSILLMLDVLLNFSKSFLPTHRGGTQDAPLVLNGRIDAKEVDDQILDLELVDHYPLDLYVKSQKGLHSGEIFVENVKKRINEGSNVFGSTKFTHDCSDFNLGVGCSNYKIIATMADKVDAQMELCKKNRAVDESDVARLIIDRHFMRDLKGNLRKFSQQKFRCSNCNESFRRPPLGGKCFKCGGKIIFTVSYGGIVKYLNPALKLINDYNVSPYVGQDLELVTKYIESIFGKNKEKQIELNNWEPNK